jgi:MFS family permease
LSFLAVIAGLLLMKVAPFVPIKMVLSLFDYLKEGIAYGVQTSQVRRTLLFLSLLSLVALPYSVLMPIFTKTILNGGAGTFGFLMGGAGFGALLGTLTLARLGSKDFERTILLVSMGTGVSFIAFSFSKMILLSFFILIVMGFCLMSQLTSTNTLLQSIVPDRLRGRLMSFYGFVLLGIAPFGSLMAGFFAEQIGAPLTLLSSGIFVLLGALLFYRKGNNSQTINPVLTLPPESS